MEGCIFCEIIKGTIPSSIVFEDELCVAIMDIKPVNKGHVLIIPKEHKQFVSEYSDETASRVFCIANKINTAIRKTTIRCEGINYFLADGEIAFQEVFHCHLHCFPRYRNDGFKLKFSEEYYSKKSERNDLNEIAIEIKSNLRF